MDAFTAMPIKQQKWNLREPLKGAALSHGEKRPEPLLEFARATAAGLSMVPRRLESRFLYDARGSALFDLITRQPEYYLTRTEAAILAGNAHRIRARTGPTALVELGSGSSIKTDYLLRAWLAAARIVRYYPVDVSEAALQGACRAISAAHPRVQVVGVNSDYRGSFALLRELSPSLILFLGSTIGNFSPAEMSGFLRHLTQAMSPEDFFMVGIDLVKEPCVVEAAYNDAAGGTAEFTRNLFLRINRELGSAIDLTAVEHVARYNPALEQVEIGARFTRRQEIRIAPLDLEFCISPGEIISTEISRKFRLQQFTGVLAEAGLSTEHVFTDESGWFALLLVQPTPAFLCGTDS